MKSHTALVCSVCLLSNIFTQLVIGTLTTQSASGITAPTPLVPCGAGLSCTVIQQLDRDVQIYAYADFIVTQVVANVTYDVTTYRDTTITNKTTVMPKTSLSLPDPGDYCNGNNPLTCFEYGTAQYAYATTVDLNIGMNITSGHVYGLFGTLQVLNTGYAVSDGGPFTTCLTDTFFGNPGGTNLPYYSQLIDLGTSIAVGPDIPIPPQLTSLLLEDPRYTIPYPELSTCSFGYAAGAPVYQILVTQLTATTTNAQSIDLDYDSSAVPAPSIPTPVAATSNPQPNTPHNTIKSAAPAPATLINSVNSPASTSARVVLVPTTITNQKGSPIVTSAPVLYSLAISTNSAGIPIVTSIPIQDPNAITTHLYIPITTTNAAGTPITTSSTIQAIIVSGTTYLVPTAPPANPTAAPGSPNGPASIITFSGSGVPSVITVGSSLITADSSSDFVIGGQTLTPGGAITVGSSVISLAGGAATGSGPGSLVISVFGGPTATRTGTGGVNPSNVAANDGVRKAVGFGVMIKTVVVGVVIMCM